MKTTQNIITLLLISTIVYGFYTIPPTPENSMVEIWVYDVKDGKVVEPGYCHSRNRMDAKNRMLETTRYYRDGKTQWDYHQVFTYGEKQLSEEYFFTSNSAGEKKIIGKWVHTYSPNGKHKHIYMFTNAEETGDADNARWKPESRRDYRYDSKDSLLECTAWRNNNRKQWSETYNYDSVNKILNSEFRNLDIPKLNRNNRLHYSANGQLLYKVEDNPADQYYDSINYVYKGQQLAEETGFNRAGIQYIRKTYTYNAQSRISEIHFFGRKDKLEKVETWKYAGQ